MRIYVYYLIHHTGKLLVDYMEQLKSRGTKSLAISSQKKVEQTHKRRSSFCHAITFIEHFVHSPVSCAFAAIWFNQSQFNRVLSSQGLNVWTDVFKMLLHAHEFDTGLNKGLNRSCSFILSQGVFASHDPSVCFAVRIYAYTVMRTCPFHEVEMPLTCLLTPLYKHHRRDTTPATV